jgi:glucose/arabinose dehydrogenase
MPNLSALRIYIPLVCLFSLTACNDHSSSADNTPPPSPTACGIEAENGMPIKVIPFLSDLSFARPVFMLQPPGVDTRWYVLEQGGAIYRVDTENQNKNLLINLAEFYDISDCAECGLLGMAFHPDFANNGFIYLSFMEGSGNSLTSYIARFRSADGGLTIARDSTNPNVPERLNILQIDQPFSNHNGGHIAFGPDGFLYFGMGDGGSANDPLNNGQKLNTRLGKMLRLQDDGSAAPGNVLAAQGALPEIYAYGLRNPWRWSFDRQTNELWAGDVGQNAFEEIDIIRNGLNYGWRCHEAGERTNNNCTTSGPYEPPVAAYGRVEGVSVTGGYVYRGTALDALEGAYLFGDFGSGRIWGLFANGSGGYRRELLFDTEFNIPSFAESNSGEIFVLNYSGSLHKIAATDSPCD